MASNLTNEQFKQDQADASLEPDAWSEIPPKIAEAQEAFRRDLPELLKTHYRKWVAYHGDERIGFGRSQTKLVQECLARGLAPNQFVVRAIWSGADDDDCEMIRPPFA